MIAPHATAEARVNAALAIADLHEVPDVQHPVAVEATTGPDGQRKDALPCSPWQDATRPVATVERDGKFVRLVKKRRHVEPSHALTMRAAHDNQVQPFGRNVHVVACGDWGGEVWSDVAAQQVRLVLPGDARPHSPVFTFAEWKQILATTHFLSSMDPTFGPWRIQLAPITVDAAGPPCK